MPAEGLVGKAFCSHIKRLLWQDFCAVSDRCSCHSPPNGVNRDSTPSGSQLLGPTFHFQVISVHSVSENFSCRHDKPSGVVWT